MQSSDFKWFCDHYDELFAKFGHSFLAIKNETVIGQYSSFADGVRMTEKTETPGSFIVQECASSPDAYNCYIASMNF